MKRTIITISRETGSGGHTVGERLAQRLGYAFYDAEITLATAKKLGMDVSHIQENEESVSDTSYIDMVSGFIPYNPFARKKKVPSSQIHQMQKRVIQQVADEGHCIIVGRCADHILKDHPEAFHVFIHAGMDHRVARVQSHEGVTGQEDRIREELEVKDRARASYYQYFTNRPWAVVGNYDLVLNTGTFTEDQCVDLILEAVKKAEERN